MAITYELDLMKRLVNAMMGATIRLGMGPKRAYLLTTRGRKTGKLHSNPVSLVVQGDQRWLVAPYGEVNWVRNARAAGEVMLRQGGKSETLEIQELNAHDSAPILKAYLPNEPITQPYFDARPDAPLEAFAAEASRHPVFRLVAKPA